MSHDALNDFVEKLNTDGSLRTALQGRFGDLSSDIPADDLIAFAGDHGYEFSVVEAEDELSETALEGVAGGIGLASPKVEIGAPRKHNFEELKVVYIEQRKSFNLIKIG